MKRILVCLFAAGVLLGCSKSDDPTPAPTSTPVATDVIKLYNKATSAEIVDGAVLTYATTVERDCTLSFYFKNLTSSAIKVKAKIVSITGSNGSGGELCIGSQCYNPIAVGSSYPAQGDPVVDIAANGTAGDGRDAYKFRNINAPTAPATKIDYVIEFYQYDSSNNVVGKTIKVTYRHQP